jgi:hypothetical protein
VGAGWTERYCNHSRADGRVEEAESASREKDTHERIRYLVALGWLNFCTYSIQRGRSYLIPTAKLQIISNAEEGMKSLVINITMHKRILGRN